MDDFTKIITAIFGGVLTLAIISVVISKKSAAPQAIQAISSGIANIVGAAVNPAATNNGNNGTSMFSDPSSAGGGGLGEALGSIKGFASSVNSATSTLGSIGSTIGSIFG